MDEYIAFEHPEEMEYMTVRFRGASVSAWGVDATSLMCVLSSSSSGSGAVVDIAWTIQIKSQVMCCGSSAGGQGLEQEFSAFI